MLIASGNAMLILSGTQQLSAEQRALTTGFPDQDFAAWLNAQLDTITRHEAAHQRHPVPAHGDLFVDNLIVQPDGRLAIIDVVIRADPRLTSDSASWGPGNRFTRSGKLSLPGGAVR